MSLPYFRSVRTLISLKLVLAFFVSNFYFYTAEAAEIIDFTDHVEILTIKPTEASLTGKIFDSAQLSEIQTDCSSEVKYYPPCSFPATPLLEAAVSGLLRVQQITEPRPAAFGKIGHKLFVTYCSLKIPVDSAF